MLSKLAQLVALALIGSALPCEAAKTPTKKVERMPLVWQVSPPIPFLHLSVTVPEGQSKDDVTMKVSDGQKANMDTPAWFLRTPNSITFTLLAKTRGVQNTWTLFAKDKPIARGTFNEDGVHYVAGPTTILDSAWKVSDPMMSTSLGYITDKYGALPTFTQVFQVTEPDGKVLTASLPVIRGKSPSEGVWGWFPESFNPKPTFKTGTYKWSAGVPAKEKKPMMSGTIKCKVNKSSNSVVDMVLNVDTKY